MFERSGIYAGISAISGTDWKAQCRLWKERYPVVTQEHYRTLEDGRTNIYAFYHEMTNLFEGRCQSGGQCRDITGSGESECGDQKGQRFITNPNTASMGYCLPAAIGVARASGGEVVCVTGEGSLQMNLQELQTIRHNRFPIKLFVINNEGYHSIRQTQMSFFGEPLVGVGEESGI